jgi:hypothetical protein
MVPCPDGWNERTQIKVSLRETAFGALGFDQRSLFLSCLTPVTMTPRRPAPPTPHRHHRAYARRLRGRPAGCVRAWLRGSTEVRAWCRRTWAGGCRTQACVAAGPALRGCSTLPSAGRVFAQSTRQDEGTSANNRPPSILGRRRTLSLSNLSALGVPNRLVPDLKRAETLASLSRKRARCSGSEPAYGSRVRAFDRV